MTERQPAPSIVERADAIAAHAHRHQTRRQGAPYIAHPRAVRTLVEDLLDALGMPKDPEILAAALVHDVIEDSATTERELADALSPRVADVALALTRPPQDKHATWANIAAHDDDAVRIIKAADRAHNLFELQLIDDPAFLARKLEETEAHALDAIAACRDPRVGAALRAILDDSVSLLSGTDRSARPGLYVIVDVDAATTTERVDALIDAAALAGAVLVQVRAKGVRDRAHLDIARRAAVRLERRGPGLVVNDRVDIARAVGAGVHVGLDDLPPTLCREVLGPGPVVGASSHTPAELASQLDGDALSYAAYGPVFLSATKQGHAEVTGLDALARATVESPVPVCAIGGIDSPARMAAVARAGAHTAAVISAFARAAEPAFEGRRLALAFIAAHAARTVDGKAGKAEEA